MVRKTNKKEEINMILSDKILPDTTQTNDLIDLISVTDIISETQVKIEKKNKATKKTPKKNLEEPIIK
jgi:hypothetical protein